MNRRLALNIITAVVAMAAIVLVSAMCCPGTPKGLFATLTALLIYWLAAHAVKDDPSQEPVLHHEDETRWADDRAWHQPGESNR